MAGKSQTPYYEEKEEEPRWPPSRTLESGAPTRAWPIDPGGRPRTGSLNNGDPCRPPGRPWCRGAAESLLNLMKPRRPDRGTPAA
ncbi:hypothetical protein NDU88_005978 [Pleurodeles waltl]|uniref:Uncharacterized protein n=1 Tax=Pleurodeles waltl TaxID=8319 RepID=A0AAV7PQ30_PLEWA|nr:hypothetical protein NDU88_005978 [Pleurodeles waltl]